MKTRILIIDDEPRWIAFARSDLGEFEIVVATSEETARAKLDTEQFDLVIVSANYLGLVGHIAEEYDEQVIVTTVQPTTQEALAAYRSGAKRYVPKSFGQQDLFEHVQDVIQPPGANGSGEGRGE